MMQSNPQIALEETITLFQSYIHGSVIYDAPGHPRVLVRVIEKFFTEDELIKFDPTVTQKMLEANRETFKKKAKTSNGNGGGSGNGYGNDGNNNNLQRNTYSSNYSSSSFSSPGSSGYSSSFNSPSYYK
jgi:hypothetical protein